ncbi:hypothetical protein, partial [Variovorax rhizosphaerae]
MADRVIRRLSTGSAELRRSNPPFVPYLVLPRAAQVELTDKVTLENPGDRISIIMSGRPGGVTDYSNMLAKHTGNARVLTFHKDLRVDGDTVLLNVSGYEYARYGAPFHLLAWVRRNRPRMKRFGVFMHEAYAVSKRITSSVFWVWRAQRYVASQLAKRSDFWISNTHYVHDWLETEAGDLPHICLPVYSTVGELSELPPMREKKVAVVFGTEPLRTNTWQAGGEPLFRWAAVNGVEIHDVGSPIQDPELAAAMQAHGVIAHGRLPSKDVQELLTCAT